MKLCRILKRTLREMTTGSTLVVRSTPQGPRFFCADGDRLQFLVPVRKAQRLIEGGYAGHGAFGRRGYTLTAAGRRLLDREAA